MVGIGHVRSINVFGNLLLTMNYNASIPNEGKYDRFRFNSHLMQRFDFIGTGR
jgi:hypothetical protein